VEEAASQDTLELALVIVAGALGAVLGDSALYSIARTGPKRLKARLEAGARKDASCPVFASPSTSQWV
jgi:membrane protein DedA with SNARE-associated domain